MSEEGDESFKTRILKSLFDIEENEITSVLEYVRSDEFVTDLRQMRQLSKDEEKLAEIGKSIKEIIPFQAEFDTESIVMPDVGDNADCNDENTCHVDEFLYDDNDIDDLVAKGKVLKYICLDCKSRNIKELILISHSMSKKILQFIFKVLLPEDLQGKKVLDIGSRLGSVLYAAYHFSNADKIVGIEKNKEMCELQEKIIDTFSMDKNRIHVINANILDCSDITHEADIIILNVLDFFVSLEEQKEIWLFFMKWFKKGAYFITNRAIPETLGFLGLEHEYDKWITVCKPFQLNNEKLFDLAECNYSDLFLYVIKDLSE